MIFAALSNILFTTTAIAFDDIPRNCSVPWDQSSPFDHIPIVKFKGVEIPLHILQPFEEVIDSAKTATEAQSNSTVDRGTLSIPVAFNATVRRLMTLAAENVCHSTLEPPSCSLRLQHG